MSESNSQSRAADAARGMADRAAGAVQDTVTDAADDLIDGVEDAVNDVVEDVSTEAKRAVRERPVLLIAALLVIAGLFLIMSLFSGGPVQFFQRLFLPVGFITRNEGQDFNWGEVFVTDPPQTYDPQNFNTLIAEELLHRINSAEKSIHIAAFDFNLTPIAEALIAAHNRGVDVRWYTDDEHGLGDDDSSGGGQFAMMQAAGIPVRADQRNPLMHNKFIVFDDQVVWTGSTNLTQNGLYSNNNNVIILEDEGLANMFGREFNELWRGSAGGSSRSTFFRQRTALDGTPIQVFFSPEDNAADYLVPLVSKARKEIRFLAFSFTHDGLGEELVRQSQQGVDVRGVLEGRNVNDEFTELHRLACNGIDVRIDGNPGTMHHKVFVIDQTIVVTGSFNFSNNADNVNDENMLFLNNAEVGPLYLAEFERVWSEARVPTPEEVVCR